MSLSVALAQSLNELEAANASGLITYVKILCYVGPIRLNLTL